MTTLFEPEYLEGLMPTAVSSEAETIRQNQILSQVDFLNNSVYTKSLYLKWLESLFDTYKSEWLNETKYFSDNRRIFNNQYYQKIISQGAKFLPFIIQDLRTNDYHWFHALSEITGVNPIQLEHLGNIDQMKNDWLTWAVEYARP